MATDPTTKLMERVLRESGGNYLSDLHADINAESVSRAVRAIPVSDYPAEAWEELANYIASEQRSYDDADTAVETLLAYLKSYL